MTLIVDASVIVAALVDSGREGQWAEEVVLGEALAAPQHLHVEVTNVLRRASRAGDLTDDAASLAHADLLDLRVRLFSYHPLADRVWDLRDNLTSYDAWYVALAEELEAPLATLDTRLRSAPGPTCEFMSGP